MLYMKTKESIKVLLSDGHPHGLEEIVEHVKKDIGKERSKKYVYWILGVHKEDFSHQTQRLMVLILFIVSIYLGWNVILHPYLEMLK